MKRHQRRNSEQQVISEELGEQLNERAISKRSHDASKKANFVKNDETSLRFSRIFHRRRTRRRIIYAGIENRLRMIKSWETARHLRLGNTFLLEVVGESHYCEEEQIVVDTRFANMQDTM